MAQNEDFKWINGLTFKEGMELREAQRIAKQEIKRMGAEPSSSINPQGTPAQQNLKDLRIALEEAVSARLAERKNAKVNQSKASSPDEVSNRRSAANSIKNLNQKSLAEELTVQVLREPGAYEGEIAPSASSLDTKEIKERKKAKSSRPEIVKATPLNSPSFKPRPCPRCGHNDQIKKYSGIVSAQTTTSTGTAVTNRGMFKTNYVTTSKSTAASNLASREKPPTKPFNPAGILSIGIIGCVLFLSVWPLLLVSLVVLAFGCHATFSYSGKKDYQRSLQGYYDKKARFENTWYCSRCDFIYA